MTRFIHDKFAKDYLEELLKDYGEVKASEKVSGEIKEMYIYGKLQEYLLLFTSSSSFLKETRISFNASISIKKASCP